MSILAIYVGAFGAVKTWDGGGNNLNLATAGNWVDDVAPVANDDLVFPDGSASPVIFNDYAPATAFRSFTINGDNYVFNGNNLRITGDLLIYDGNHAINSDLVLVGENQFLSVFFGSELTITQLTTGTAEVTFDGDGNYILRNIRGSGGAAIIGGGNLFFNGGSGYTGDTIYIESGYVELNANFPDTTAYIFLGTLSGNGSAGNIINDSGSVFPKNSPFIPTVLTSKNLFLNNFSSFMFTYSNVGGSTPPFSRINVTGTVTVGSAILISNFNNQNTPIFNVPSIIIDNDGTDPVVGTFFGLSEGAVFSLFDVSYRISYVGGTGNDITITALSSVDPDIENPTDFDGDLKTDIAIFRPSLGQWWYLRSSDNSNRAFSFGSSTDKIVPADYTGDGKTDIATFNPTTGFWSIMRSEDSTFYGFPFGTNGDIAAPADYDGDGKADAAVFRTSNSTWYISKSSGGTIIQQFGASGDRPTVADYDGDGKADLAIYRVALGQWWYLLSSDGTNRAFQFGTSTDKPLQGDYTGDGKADLAFFRPTTGEWFVLRSEDSTFYGFPFGASGDIPASGDYDGDGRFDAAVFRPSNTTWYLNRSTSGVGIVGFGANGDIPVPNAFVP